VHLSASLLSLDAEACTASHGTALPCTALHCIAADRLYLEKRRIAFVLGSVFPLTDTPVPPPFERPDDKTDTPIDPLGFTEPPPPTDVPLLVRLVQG
jgi:hypothetical protein